MEDRRQPVPAAIDRYRRVGLRGNPFAAGETAAASPALFVPRGLPPEAPDPGSGAFVQVIGHSGAGKSTHLNRWRRQTPGPLHYIPYEPYHRRWQRPPVGSIVYGDEIDRMPAPLRRRWFRLLASRSSTLVVGTHVDLSDLARRAGFGQAGADLVTYRLGPVDRDELDAMLDARIAAASIDDRARTVSLLTDDDRQRILDRSAGSIRRAETIGHELIAERVRWR